MKRILTTMCALTLILAAAVPALAVEPEQSASYYPTSVEEYMEGDSPRIKKVYQLSLADDPSQIPTEDFERDGRLYYLLDMTRKDEVGVDSIGRVLLPASGSWDRRDRLGVHPGRVSLCPGRFFHLQRHDPGTLSHGLYPLRISHAQTALIPNGGSLCQTHGTHINKGGHPT